LRDVCRTGRQDRARPRGKSDELDSDFTYRRMIRDTAAHPARPS
jgi:hypothetical protein